MSKIYETKEEYYKTFYGIHDENSPDIVFIITNQGTTNYTSVPTITITPTVTSTPTALNLATKASNSACALAFTVSGERLSNTF